jgi:hypothetical protein
MINEDISLDLEAAPPPTGRYKLDGSGTCYWEPNDSGADQCQMPTGRWKDDGNGGCYWDPNDSGPDQCLQVSQVPDPIHSSEHWRYYATSVPSQVIAAWIGGLAVEAARTVASMLL